MSSKMVGRKSVPSQKSKSVEKVVTKIKKRNVDRLVEELYCDKKLTKEQKAKKKDLEDYLVRKLEKFSVNAESSSSDSDSECSTDCSCCSDSESCSCSDCCSSSSSGTDSDTDSSSGSESSSATDSDSESDSDCSSGSSSDDAQTRKPTKSFTLKAKLKVNPVKGKSNEQTTGKPKMAAATIKKERPDTDAKRKVGKLDGNNNNRSKNSTNKTAPAAVVIKTEPKERARKTL